MIEEDDDIVISKKVSKVLVSVAQFLNRRDQQMEFGDVADVFVGIQTDQVAFWL